MILTTLVFASLSVILLFYLLKWVIITYKDYMIMSKLPGPPSRGLLIGNVSFLQASPEEIFRRLRECKKNFYPIYKLYALHRVTAGILSPEDCELILSNPKHNEKGQIYELLHKWLKFGLLTSSGKKWQTRRRILTPAFHFNILQQFIIVFNEEAEELVNVLKKECDNPYVDVSPLVTQFTLKTIAETAMGTKLKFNTKKEVKYKEAVYEIGKILLYRLMHPWCIFTLGNILSPYYLREFKVTKTLHDFTREVIEERESKFKEFEIPQEEHDVYKGKKRLAMLDLLLLAKIKEKIIDNEGIQEEVDTFMFEGHDTTSVALSFLLMLLACHKDVQDRIVDEMKTVLVDIHKKPTYNDLLNLKYLERCVKESLRLYPSVHFMARRLGEDVVTHNGHFLPKGTSTTIFIYDIHHDADIYPDPEKFDPDRFLPENSQHRHPFAYLPFSAGPRNCIGQKFAMLELKAAVRALLANFILEPVDTPDSIVVIVDIVLRTKEGIKIKFVPRLSD